MSDYFRQAILKYAQSTELYSAQQQLFNYQRGLLSKKASRDEIKKQMLDRLKRSNQVKSQKREAESFQQSVKEIEEKEKEIVQKTLENKTDAAIGDSGINKEQKLDLLSKLKQNALPLGSSVLGAGAGGLLAANLFKDEDEDEEDEKSFILRTAVGAAGGAGLGYLAGNTLNKYLSKESSLEEKYQKGFANRAAQYGFSEQAALDLLKEIRDKKRVLVSIEGDKNDEQEGQVKKAIAPETIALPLVVGLATALSFRRSLRDLTGLHKKRRKKI
jgi:hypothetical protein